MCIQIDTDMHAGYTFPPSCTRKGTRKGTHRSGDDMMTFCRPFPLSHTNTHTISLSLSLGLVWKCSAASVPLNRQAQPLPTIGDDAAVLTLPALSVFGHASTPLFSFFFLLFLFFSSFFFWCAKKQQEHALSHVHTLVSHSTPTHPPSFVPVQTQRRDGIA